MVPQSRNSGSCNDCSDDDATVLVDSANDSALFAELFRRHNTAVLAYFVRRTACPQTAADLTSETFAQAFASRGRFTKTGAPARAWLFTIARRQLTRFIRREQVSRKYRRRLGIDTTVQLGVEDLERIDELTDSGPQRAAAALALESLPANQREAVRLRVAEDLSYSEVATHLGCTEGAARVRVSRGLRSLADLLDIDEHFVQPEPS